MTINNATVDALAAVMELTGGLGADVAIEAVGLPETFELCTELVRPGGRVANVGVHGHSATLHLETLWIRDLTITTGLVDTFSTPRLLDLVAEGKLNTLPFATHYFPLDETMSAYDTFADAATTNALKVVLAADPIDGKPAVLAWEGACRRRLTPTAAVPVDVILRDGSTLAAEGARARAMRAPSSRSSSGSPSTAATCASTASRHVDAALVEHFLDPDWVERGALIGVLADAAGDERIVALAEYARLRDPTAAEVAFTVADDLQGRGAATRLLEQLAARAGRRRDRALRRGGAARERGDARGLPRRGLRGVAHARRRRGRGALPDRIDRAVPRARRGARPRRGRRVAATVLRAGEPSP